MRRRKPAPKQNLQQLAVLVLTLGLVLFFGIKSIVTASNLPQRPQQGQSLSRPDTPQIAETEPAPEEPAETALSGKRTPVASATILSTGDVLMHKPLIEAAAQADGTYDFSHMFRYIREYVQKADYAVANLETTLGGPGNPYQGAPAFNCPDSLVDAARDAGFDLFLTANNHCADTGTAGVIRTVETVRAKGMATLGTNLNDEENKYIVTDINGIQVGMLCYTYAGAQKEEGRPSLNGGAYLSKKGLVCYYLNDNLDAFYQLAQSQFTQMKAAGAEATVIYMHWGPEEYQLDASIAKQMIAQKLCDIGYDVIIGGHPHVVEPLQLLTSTVDPEHKTVCLYSMGNAVSNQRVAIDAIANSCPTGHTEDGVLFSVTFEKYDDGSVALAQVDVIPTWVELSSSQKYVVIPLEYARQDSWGSLYSLENADSAKRSFDRTMALVGGGLAEIRAYLSNE